MGGPISKCLPWPTLKSGPSFFRKYAIISRYFKLFSLRDVMLEDRLLLFEIRFSMPASVSRHKRENSRMTNLSTHRCD